MSNHVNPKVNNKFYEWVNQNYGKLKKVTVTRGIIYGYLGMTIDFSSPGKVKFRMDKYVKKMLNDFPMKLKSTGNGSGKILGKEGIKTFHTFVAKYLFLCKHA